MLHPQWLKTFATAAAASSFSETGRRLNITQSTVSEHIRQLEAALGRRLFVRDSHSLALTGDGETLLVHARLILEAHEAAEAQFTGPKLRGRVRFGTSDDLVQGPVPDNLAAFRRRHPDVELGITVQPGHLPMDGLAPPRLTKPLPELPDVQYVAIGARKLTPPAQTLLQILKDAPIG